MNDIWNKIVASYSQNPRDVITTPSNNAKGKWFHVYVANSRVYVSPAKDHTYSANLKCDRPLDSKKCEILYSMHVKRKKGLLIRSEIAYVTQNSSYWFGIFDDLQL